VEFSESRKLNTDRYKLLPFSTKISLARDIARGLSALHSYGVIHGDMKSQNILIFHNPELTAKLADFSHSFLDTGEIRRLVGGTPLYSAPEWNSTATTEQLLQTDVYSYGIVFANLMVGFDIFRQYEDKLSQNLENGQMKLQDLKATGLAIEYVKNVMHEADTADPALALDDLPTVLGVIDLTLQLDPSDRKLGAVLALFKEE